MIKIFENLSAAAFLHKTGYYSLYKHIEPIGNGDGKIPIQDG
ncbi:hypothetical protein [Sphingobacterium bambusae]|uniref:Uncharacterized protein n=1 Tax=Sphingobacterium bambusae TaxID=662858 RepID=A0ABW6BLD1_9SPHI|nr:hypothetical protein [Sphingobacterium bambusae]WPL48850.1 hypothetical protein SCB77_00015 [Sphingobacterium bambusae]WPL49103.1 hypothetical protein SCB77_01320 [Sphingobacterium bambusae]